MPTAAGSLYGSPRSAKIKRLLFADRLKQAMLQLDRALPAWTGGGRRTALQSLRKRSPTPGRPGVEGAQYGIQPREEGVRPD